MNRTHVDRATQVNDKKKIALPYQLFRWGPCLVKLSISKENQELFLKEAKASSTDFETRLAGIVNKQVAFRDYKMFEGFFGKINELYADALKKWTGDDSIDFSGNSYILQQ